MEMLVKVQQNLFKQQKMIVDVTEVDPICAMQACFDGYSVVSAYKDGESVK